MLILIELNSDFVSHLDIAIKVENLGKKYVIGKKKDASLRGSLSNIIKSNSSKTEEFWALKNLSFEINPGEVVGIIGKNGAGKSTLLKLLSHITSPTEGRIEINGRVASLLEVGTGFHPELTGLENIYLNGTILGMTRKEVKTKLDEIVAFSGVGKFIDTPVKHYSSGMYVRLAFAVAAHLEPEILIIDEVLAVGDAEFQKKCLGKMEEVANQGRTVLFVSHNLVAVKTLCNKSIVLNNGSIEYLGDVHNGIAAYTDLIKKSNNLVEWDNNPIGNDTILLKKVNITSESGEVDLSEQIDIITEFEYLGNISSFNLSLVLNTVHQECVFNLTTPVTKIERGKYRCVLQIPKNSLNNIMYSIDLYFVEDSSFILFLVKDVLTFEVNEKSRHVDWFGEWIGVTRPTDYNFTINQL